MELNSDKTTQAATVSPTEQPGSVSITRRLTFWLILTVCLASLMAGYWMYSRANADARTLIENRVERTLDNLSGTLDLPLWNVADDMVRVIGETVVRDNGIYRLDITNFRGEALYSFKGEDGSELFAGQRDIFHGDVFIGRIAIAFTDRHSVTTNRALFKSALITALFIAVSLTLATGLFFKFFFKSPLDQINGLVDSYLKGEHNRGQSKIVYKEFQPVERAFNEMVATIDERTLKLKESEEHFRGMLEQSPIGLCLCRADGSYVTVNSAYKRIVGYDDDELASMTYWDITPEVYLELERSQTEELNRTGSYGPIEKQYVHKDGHLVPVRLNGMCLTRNNERFTWSSVEDISAFKQAEEERAGLSEQLRQAQKMEAVGTLAGGIAHDFNNILAAIMGYTELSLANPDCPGKIRSNLQHVDSAAKRAKDLVKQILMFSRKEKAKRERLLLGSVIEEAAKLLEQSIPVSVAIDLSLDTDVGMVLGNSTQIHQVIMNLCTNAYHAMPDEAGVISISLRAVEVDGVTASEYPSLRAGRYALLRITDNGSGMPPEVVARIFEPFYTTKAYGKGTGMGLSVVHGIIHEHDGAIGVESEVGRGTSFSVYLPLIDRMATDEPGAEKKVVLSGTERILLVDDEVLLVELGEAMLQARGYRVTTKSSAADALQLFAQDPDGFDLIISDQTMPEVTGDVLAKKAMLLRPDIPVIICTGYSSLIDSKKARTIGIKALLMKPIDEETLLMEVRRVLDGSERGANT